MANNDGRTVPLVWPAAADPDIGVDARATPANRTDLFVGAGESKLISMPSASSGFASPSVGVSGAAAVGLGESKLIRWPSDAAAAVCD